MPRVEVRHRVDLARVGGIERDPVPMARQRAGGRRSAVRWLRCPRPRSARRAVRTSRGVCLRNAAVCRRGAGGAVAQVHAEPRRARVGEPLDVQGDGLRLDAGGERFGGDERIGRAAVDAVEDAGGEVAALRIGSRQRQVVARGREARVEAEALVVEAERRGGVARVVDGERPARLAVRGPAVGVADEQADPRRAPRRGRPPCRTRTRRRRLEPSPSFSAPRTSRRGSARPRRCRGWPASSSTSPSSCPSRGRPARGAPVIAVASVSWRTWANSQSARSGWSNPGAPTGRGPCSARSCRSGRRGRRWPPPASPGRYSRDSRRRGPRPASAGSACRSRRAPGPPLPGSRGASATAARRCRSRR